MSTTLGRPRTRPDTPINRQYRRDSLRTYYRTSGVLGWARTALANARRRAKRKGIECSLVLDDVLGLACKVSHCPILGLRLIYGRGHRQRDESSASIDRIDNTANYSRDTIAIISAKANAIKSNFSIAELIKIGDYAKKVHETN